MSNVNQNHYNVQYDTKRRFISYWHQIDEIIQRTPKSVLEIGIGNGFVARYLKEAGIFVTTCDINEKLKPDYLSSVINLPFKDSEFEIVTACEILEHLPYNETLLALREIWRVCAKVAVISIPDTTRAYRVELPLPKIGKFKKLLIVPKRNSPVHRLAEDGHYWEIGKRDYPLSRIMSDFKKTDFTIEKTYRIFENPYHRFFILKKNISHGN